MLILSNLTHGRSLEQGQPVARMRLRTPASAETALELLAGVHTSDSWWERPASRPSHARAPVESSWRTKEGFEGHVYKASFPVAQAGIAELEITSASRATLSLLLVVCVVARPEPQRGASQD